MPYNRELLASISFEPSGPYDTLSDDLGTEEESSKEVAPSSQHGAVNDEEDADSSQNEATKIVIQCLKVALAKSITSISHPAKKRPLDPQKDFTIETTMDLYSLRTGVACCSTDSIRVKSRRTGPPTSAYLVGEKDREESGQDGSCFRLPNESVAMYYDDNHVPQVFDEDEDLTPLSATPRRGMHTGRHGNSPRAYTDEDEDEEPPPVSFTFTDFSPMCYRHIREFFDVDRKAYGDVLINSRWHSIPTPGKSAAQLFFCGRDWVIKTMTNTESNFLRRILHRYYYHVRDNPFTLLPHFVGHHRLVIGSKAHNIIIMQNVFATTNTIHEKFDLKGSTIGRFASEAEKRRATCTQKDLDINNPLHVGNVRRKLLIAQVKKDCEFLKRSHIMDYSFLVGIHVLPKTAEGTLSSFVSQYSHQVTGTATLPFSGIDTGAGNRSFLASSLVEALERDNDAIDGRCFTADEGGMQSDEAPGLRGEVYYLGIIDILQEYNARKKLENLVFGAAYDYQRISCVNPNDYAARFVNFMSSIIV